MVARLLFVCFLLSSVPLWPQAEYRVYNEHPRIWLEPDRLVRLQREAERETTSWLRLVDMVAEPSQLHEPAFAQALVFRSSGDEAVGRAAIDWALEAAAHGFNHPGDLRQASLVFDWCQPLLNDQERQTLLAGLVTAIDAVAASADANLLDVRDGLLASIAVSGAWDGAESATGKFLQAHWDARLLPAMLAGDVADRAEELQAALEIAHVVRTNLDHDLWADSPQIFRDLAMARILSYLPEDIETPEGRARRPSVVPPGSDEQTEAVVGRIAEMILVAYDSASRNAQFLQGWLRSDAHQLRGRRGAPYEYLWINPYLPGLSPRSGPQSAYDPTRGRFFARSGWDGDGLWLGFFDGVLMRYFGGVLDPVEPNDRAEAIAFPGFAIALPAETARFDARILPGEPADGQRVYLLGLDDAKTYEVRIGSFGWQDYQPRGGVIVLTNSPERELGEVDFLEPQFVRIRPAKP
jgi:hypothetical protein